MDCKDLMIGDWVNYSILNINSKVVSIIGNHTITIQFVDKNNKVGVIHGLLEETINPIHLTEDILKKNGFDRQYYDDGNSYWWAVFDGWFNVNFDHSECSEGEFRCVGFSDLVINYVHQLQHLLRLCGIEKELVID